MSTQAPLRLTSVATKIMSAGFWRNLAIVLGVVFSTQFSVNAQSNPSPADNYTVLKTFPPGTPIGNGNKIPLILIHGIHGNQKDWTPVDTIDDPNFDYWGAFKRYFMDSGQTNVLNSYKLYAFHYVSDKFTVWEIARALRNHLDALVAVDPTFDKPFVIIAHSMGGLVARSYMEEHWHMVGQFAGRPAGERVSRLITLATPHHGTPIANDKPRVDESSHPVWDLFIRGGDAFWLDLLPSQDQDQISRVVNVWEPNRRDLRWDNFDGLWDSVPSEYVNDPNELNDWLRGIAHAYDNKIVAYYGYVGPNSPYSFQIEFLSSLPPPLLLDTIVFSKIFGDKHGSLLGAGVFLQRTQTSNTVGAGFDSTYLFSSLANDGVVPLRSSAFDDYSVAKRIECPTHDHLDMLEGTGGLCADGFSAFGSVSRELGLVPVTLPILHVLPLANIYMSVPQDQMASTPLYISNIGDGNISWNLSIQSGTTWLTASRGSGVAPDVVDLNVNTAGLGVGSYSSVVTIAAPGAQGSPLNVLVNLDVVLAGPPTVTTFAATSVTSTSATLNGSVNPNGSDTSAWFEWGTSHILDGYVQTPTQTVGSGSSPAWINAALSGLSTGTTVYYFRVAASNGVGTSRGPILSFTTAPAPTVATFAASSVASTSATLNGSVNPNGSPSPNRGWFEWGTSSTLASYASTATQTVGSGSSAVSINAALSGLSAGTTYYFRVAASNSVGTTSRGSILSFTTTAAVAPTVTTFQATSATGASAALGGGVNPNGSPTNAWFEWGTSSTLASYTSTATQYAGSGSNMVGIGATLSGLSTGTTYYFRIVASNSAGTSRGSVIAVGAPTVTTLAASSVTGTSAALNGSVNPNGVFTTAWFEWGTSSTLATYMSTATQWAGSGGNAVAISAALSGLTAGTTYYFRVAASNSAGTSRGSILSFDLPPPHTLMVNSTNPPNGVNIMVSPADNNSQGSGPTPLNRTYNQGTQVALTVPARLTNGNTFSTWSGCPSPSGTTCTVVVNSDTTVTVNYVNGPLASLSTTNMGFGNQTVNTSSAAQGVTLSNTGTAPLNISSIVMGGANGSEFTQTNTCGTTVAAGANCTITVTFQPTATGSRIAALTITDNAPGSPRTVTLSGTGVDFWITPGPGSNTTATVSAGQTAIYTLSVAGTSGFVGTTTFSCAGAPAASTCTVSPTSPTLNGTTPVTLTVSVATTARSTLLPRSWPKLLPPVFVPMLQLLGVLSILLALAMMRLKPRFPVPRLAACLVVSLLLVSLAACGGGGSSGPPPPPPRQGTPSGSYTLVVTGSSQQGSQVVSRTINLTFVVQ